MRKLVGEEVKGFGVLKNEELKLFFLFIYEGIKGEPCIKLEKYGLLLKMRNMFPMTYFPFSVFLFILKGASRRDCVG